MNCINSSLKAGVLFLNQPVIKSSSKKIASITAFIFGIIQTYNIYQNYHRKKTTPIKNQSAQSWIQIANKTVLVCARISLILNALVSRPGVFIISTTIGRCFSRAQLHYAFGPNVIFAINPWHPRHIFSLVAAALALPSMLLSIYTGAHRIYSKCTQENRSKQDTWSKNKNLHLMVLLSTFISRPAQHLGNQFFRATLAI